MSWIFVKQSAVPWTPSVMGSDLATHYDVASLSGIADGSILASGYTIPSEIAGNSDTLLVHEDNAAWTDTMAYSATGVNGMPGIGLNSRLSNGRGQLLRMKTDGDSGARLAALYGKSDVVVAVVATIGVAGTSVSSCLMSQRTFTWDVAKQYCGIYREIDQTITLSTKRTSTDAAKVITSTTTMADNSSMLVVARLNFAAGSAELRLNGGVEGSATYDASGVSGTLEDSIYNYHNLLGEGTEEKTWVGKFGEMVALSKSSGSFASGDVEKLEGYLAHKWGLSGSLSADHPYKTAAPTA